LIEKNKLLNTQRMRIISTVFLLVASQFWAWASDDIKLWYNRPAENWNEALPIGNGRLAAMVFGVPAVEHLQLNEESIWAGSPNNNANPNAKEALPVIRKLIFEGKYLEAQTMCTEKVRSNTNNGMPYQTMGDLFISFPGHNSYTDYSRDLNISKAVSTVSYKVNGVTFTRESFVSFTDQAVIVRLTASTPRSISCNMMLTSPQENREYKVVDNALVMSGITMTFEDQKGSVAFQTRVKVKQRGGTQEVRNGVISVNGADEALIYISIATNFKNYKELTVNESVKCDSLLTLAMAKDYPQALADHIAYYQKQFNRVKFDLGQTDSVKNPIDIRVRDFARGYDPQLASTYFQFGRYLLISSSQPGCQPANLQGKWNDRLFPPWDSKYTTNINAEMNYWPAEVTNLSELHDPFLQMVREVAETGSQSAQTMYGARGWVLHHNTDIWRVTGAIDKAPSGMWATGGAWVCQHLWWRYQYTGDKAFLASAYPIMKGAAQFFMNMLIPEPSHGWMVLTPASSPENTHAGSGGKATTAAGVTMDNQLIFDLFTNIIQSAQTLGIDKMFADSVRSLRNRMAPMQIGQYGQLQEWLEDWDSPKDNHRHGSHLWGLFPGSQISPFRTPELFDAARTSLIFRGDPSTGWSMAWKINWWARLLDGDHAYKLLTNQLDLVTTDMKKKGGTYANLFDAHPPFQIDGNFGCTSGITEMLMQSHDGFVYLLPALPSIWKNGSISGLIARGGFELSFSWKDGKLGKLVVLSKIGGNLRLRTLQPVKCTSRGAKMKKAAGDNPNPLYAVTAVSQPLISPKAKLNKIVLPQSFLYDIDTKTGETYEFVAGK
jgi:alpha-L-fucosidase 2